MAWYRGFEFDRCQQLYSGNLLSEKGWSLDRTMDFFEHFFFLGGDVRQLMFVHFFWDASDVCSFFFCTLDVSDAKLFIFFCRDVSDFNVCLKVARFPVVKVLDFQGTDDAEDVPNPSLKKCGEKKTHPGSFSLKRIAKALKREGLLFSGAFAVCFREWIYVTKNR